MTERSVEPGGVAIVTVAYNSSGIMEQFLSSVARADVEPPLVVIADNDSADSDETASIAARYRTRLLRLPENLGYGGAINAAVRELDESVNWVLVSNPDVTFTPGSITALREVANRRTDAGSIGPRIVDEDGTNYPSARNLPSLRTGVGHALFARIWPSNPWTRSYLQDQGETAEEATVGWLSGACVLVRRSAFNDLGGFDDGYFMYFEDVDLGARLGRAGWHNVYAPQAIVTHSGAHSTNRESGRMLRVHHDSAFRYLSRKYSAWYLAPLRGILWLGLGVRKSWLSRERGPRPPQSPSA
ncbi:glycosyltransferase family 2 protein [Salinibacterium hongtaonis]|uniref:dTDP-Rha--alpha-D-GlcNAc-pyrophosphate polyprenol alpha-3-L-rhamnosyltransferase n=1 Tax=Homoserinimonas hongtaonis TaxID=2079791 RepID=A0A2U1SWR0_9MICO|nr:glycosyltransferase family 2 protein [Salinibacterium hongtaonis]PWB96039.1 dTDP-Rha--alpha-D-GlcNAc-pyrophosphate polyprenol alpha-3-L-rhamnosyltransferase [Salinibacterium hongtaonis]